MRALSSAGAGVCGALPSSTASEAAVLTCVGGEWSGDDAAEDTAGWVEKRADIQLCDHQLLSDENDRRWLGR